MRHVVLLATLAAVGVSAAACTTTYTQRSYPSSGYTTQYVTAPGYVYPSSGYTTQYVMGPSYAYTRYDSSPYSYAADRDRDGVPNWRDRAPDNPYRY